MTLDAHDHYFPDRGPRQLRHALGPGHVQLPVVHRRPDEHRLRRLVRVLQAGRQHAAGQQRGTGYNPNGLNIITSGISISRPPRSNVYLGYTIIDTGPIKTSALNVSISYWLSPKWYGTFSESYDFGDAVSWARCSRSPGSGPIT